MRFSFFEEFNCDDCSDTYPCAEHEELAESLCAPDYDSQREGK